MIKYKKYIILPCRLYNQLIVSILHSFIHSFSTDIDFSPHNNDYQQQYNKTQFSTNTTSTILIHIHFFILIDEYIIIIIIFILIHSIILDMSLSLY
jgi:type IV secretory pathway VirB6-like protein